MVFLRKLATPWVIGSFVLSATTGLLMFFESAIGWNHDAHEWLGWALITGVLMHVVTNWASFKTYFVQKRATALPVIAVFLVLLALSFTSAGRPNREGPSPARLALTAMAEAPLSDVAPLAKMTADQAMQSLKGAGFSVRTPDDSIRTIAGDDREQQGKALEVLFKK